MEAEEFLKSAEILIKGNQEVDYRNAASRAYYCAFHLCRNFLNKQFDSQIGDEASHTRVICKLKDSPNSKLRKLGNKLEQVKRLRHAADYRLVYQFEYYKAKQTLSHSYKIKIELEDISK